MPHSIAKTTKQEIIDIAGKIRVVKLSKPPTNKLI